MCVCHVVRWTSLANWSRDAIRCKAGCTSFVVRNFPQYCSFTPFYYLQNAYARPQIAITIRSMSSAAHSSSAASPPPQAEPPNKQGIDEALYSYVVNHNREHPLLAEIRQTTAEVFPKAAKMAVSPEQGAFLAWLVGVLGAKRIIEIGVFTGYSSLAMAMAMGEGGKLIACDRDPGAMAIAEQFWQRAGVQDRVEARIGPGAETVQAMLEAGEEGSYDFAFVDADKKGYRGYYEALLKVSTRCPLHGGDGRCLVTDTACHAWCSIFKVLG